jgi:ABC-type multidrug transport system fused ATPase/permease subunit
MKSKVHFLTDCLRLLGAKATRKVKVVILVQTFLGILDLVGIVVLGILGSITISGIGLRKPGDKVSQFLDFLDLENFSLTYQVLILAGSAVSILLGKTILSLYFTKRILYFLAEQGAHLSFETTRRYFLLPLTKIQQKNSQEAIYALTAGMNQVTVGIIGASILLFSDFALLLIMFFGLLLVDPAIAISAVVMFGLIGFFLYIKLNKKAQELGEIQSALHIESQKLVSQLLLAYREIIIKNRLYYFIAKFRVTRENLANSTAMLAFQQNISKFVLEISIVIGTMVIAAIQFALQTGAHALTVLSIFLAASTRIAPAVMRIQQSLVQIKGNIGSAAPSLSLIRDLTTPNQEPKKEFTSNLTSENDYSHEGFHSAIKLQGVSYQYPESDQLLLENTNLDIKSGSVVAIVGESGMGKSTLADLMLGIITPSSGEVFVSGMPPLKAINQWPGAIAYVPQDVIIFEGTIRQNIALGFDFSQEAEARILKSVELSSLAEFISNLPDGLDAKVGDRGTSLSGGQRQRLGIARALFTNPKILLLDESTSSLDGKTESDVSEGIAGLKGNTTIIIIAHRLATIRNADQVIYLRNHKVEFVGSFNELRKASPDFEYQAKLMGL